MSLFGSALAMLVVSMCLSSCAGSRASGWVVVQPPPAAMGQKLHVIGTVQYVDLEGGLFVIREAQGVQYNPTNLPQAFRKDGMLVEAEAYQRDDMVSIHMVGPIIEIVRSRERSAAAISAVNLWGTSWRLEDLAGSGVLDRANATLAFSEAGKALGSGSCNTFRGAVTIQGESITFGQLATTRKACPEAVMNQENRYLVALREANRFRVEEPFLYLYTAGGQQPLRFIREAESAAAADSEVVSLPALTGIWTVVGHHMPAVSAMSDTEAAARHGTTVRVTLNEALSSGNHCDAPTYATRTVERDRFLASEYHLPPGRLAPLDGMQQVTLLEVSCGNGRWSAMGARLIEISPDRALAPWDGVFFELARDHDFRAAGQEPFWRLEIRKGKEMRLARPGAPDVVVPAPVPTTDRASGVQTYHAVTEAHELRVIIAPRPCTDSMSGKPFPATVTVELDGTPYSGCGEAIP